MLFTVLDHIIRLYDLRLRANPNKARKIEEELETLCRFVLSKTGYADALATDQCAVAPEFKPAYCPCCGRQAAVQRSE